MITNKQYRKLMSEYKLKPNIVISAMKADVHPQTARKYIQASQPPEQLQKKHDWRTRSDPLAGIWDSAQQMLSQAPELEAKELFEYLRGIQPDQVDASALRSFQRRVLEWRLQHGQDKEVFFPQEHPPSAYAANEPPTYPWFIGSLPLTRILSEPDFFPETLR
jgi:hypothetical protein